MNDMQRLVSDILDYFESTYGVITLYWTKRKTPFHVSTVRVHYAFGYKAKEVTLQVGDRIPQIVWDQYAEYDFNDGEIQKAHCYRTLGSIYYDKDASGEPMVTWVMPDGHSWQYYYSTEPEKLSAKPRIMTESEVDLWKNDG